MNTIVFENNLKKVLPIQGREYSRFLSVGKNLGREEDPCVVHLQFFPLHLWQEKNERKKKRIERKEGKKIKIKKKGKNFSTSSLSNERKLLILLFFVEKKPVSIPCCFLSLSSFLAVHELSELLRRI